MATQKAVAVFQTPTQDYIDKLDAEIKKLNSVNDSSYKTSGNLKDFGFNTNLKEETSIETLVKMYSAVIAREDYYNKAHEQLSQGLGGITVPMFTHQGNSSADWKNDVIVRIVIISHAEKLKKLQKLKDQARDFMTKEEQRLIWEKEMQGVLGTELPGLPASK